MTVAHIAVVGSGALARAVCHSLAAPAPPAGGRTAVPIKVTVLARGVAGTEIVQASRIRTTVAGAAVTFTAEPLRDEVEALARLRPDILLCCASAQSPYERVRAPSAWTDLIATGGFGITLPLQASVVRRLAAAVARVSPTTMVVNGAFPDAVNPLLAALGLPVAFGIGNAATLAACLQAALALPDQRGLALLGHHVHLAAPDDPADEVLAWRDDAPLAGVGSLLAAGRGLPRAELNAIAGHAAARLLVDLVAGAEIHTNLPGPLGLPGGYPVRLAGGTVALDLPAELTRADAIAWNERAGHRDGITLGGGRIGYPPSTAGVLAPYLPDLANGWPAAHLDEVSDQLTELRRRLRLAPPVALAPSAALTKERR
jgi:hypothetical protein